MDRLDMDKKTVYDHRTYENGKISFTVISRLYAPVTTGQPAFKVM